MFADSHLTRFIVTALGLFSFVNLIDHWNRRNIARGGDYIPIQQY